jgi:hypothetical protein
MAAPFDRRLFEQIFSDAHIVDVDFSKWDRSICICVVADHVDVPTPTRLPLFIVDFLRVTKFCVMFNHLDVELDDPNQHFQWNIDEFRIEARQNMVAVSLFGGKTWPRLEIDCGGIELRRIASAILDDLLPGWNKPYQGLARLGIESLAKRWRVTRQSGQPLEGGDPSLGIPTE